GDAGDAGAECCGDRGRIVGGKVARSAAGKVDDDILEHGSTLLTTRRIWDIRRQVYASLLRLGGVATRISLHCLRARDRNCASNQPGGGRGRDALPPPLFISSPRRARIA